MKFENRYIWQHCKRRRLRDEQKAKREKVNFVK